MQRGWPGDEALPSGAGLRSVLKHPYPFDPGYGYSLADLLAIQAPPPPDDFAEYWRERHDRVCSCDPRPVLRRTGDHGAWHVYDLSYQSADGLTLGGWVLSPRFYAPRRLWVIGHGYGGRDEPDWDWPRQDSVLVFPCARGMGRSRQAGLPEDPARHVLHGIEDRDSYLIGHCVDDLWLAIHAARQLFPHQPWIGYAGISFGGGLGALACPWEPLVQGVHLNMPTFGHWPLRLICPTVGSGASVRAYVHEAGHVPETLSYYDASSAAAFADVPLFSALALFDPAVAPPGQFAIHNAWAGDKVFIPLQAGHFESPCQDEETRRIHELLRTWF